MLKFWSLQNSLAHFFVLNIFQMSYKDKKEFWKQTVRVILQDSTVS